MTAPLPKKTIDDVLYAVGLGTRELRAKIAELETALENSANAESMKDADARYHRERADKLQIELSRLRAEHSALSVKAAETNEVRRQTLANMDDRMARLDGYITELEAFRDTAKVKSVGIALGHVVERLRQIRYPEDGAS